MAKDLVVGIDIGGQTSKLGIVDARGTVLAQTVIRSDNNATVLIALIWIIFNGIIGALRMIDLLDDGILILLCSAYSVCDLVCILFFCPFQTWFMKNKCCGTCRIYNWDYAMMFTPFFRARICGSMEAPP